MVKKHIDTSSIKKNNQVLILKTLLKEGAISRADLARSLKMSKPAINEHIEALVSHGIIKFRGEQNALARGGRKALLIEPNENYKFIIAVDLNFLNPLFALGNMNGNPVDKFNVVLKKNPTPEEMQKVFFESIDLLIHKNNISIDDVGIIMISSPGIIDKTKNQLLTANPQFHHISKFNFKNILELHYKVPVFIKNDVNMAAIGEKKFLNNTDFENVFYISCGLGLGSALFINGELYEGKNNTAGEVGNFVHADNTQQKLDQRLCLDNLLKTIKEDLADNVTTSLSALERNITFQDVIDAYEASDPYVIGLITAIGFQLGIVVHNVISLCDIDIVIFGGEYIVFQRVIIKEIKKFLDTHAYMHVPDVVPSGLAFASGIIGCFDYGINKMIEMLA